LSLREAETGSNATGQQSCSPGADILKEYLIGTEVYDRKAPYHPSTDSIVRSEARRLRNKLKQYHESVAEVIPSLFTIARAAMCQYSGYTERIPSS
jgi:hypothetical protein